MPQDSLLLQSVLEYAAWGWPIFPVWWVEEDGSCGCGQEGCTDIGKHPLTAHQFGFSRGFYSGTTDEDVLRAAWDRYPKANIGAATGQVSGWDVLDIDMRHEGFTNWQTLQSLFPELPDNTPISRTPSGGRHYFFRHEEGISNRSGNLPSGIDVRGDGGYVLLPTSQGPQGQYVWVVKPQPDERIAWPRWLVELILREAELPGAERRTLEGERSRREPIPDIIPDGERNLQLTRIAGGMRRQGLTAEEMEQQLLVINQRRCRNPLSPQEIEKIARSVSRYEPAESDALLRTDKGNAETMARFFGEDLRYVPAWKSWLVWDGRRWAPDEFGEVMRRAKRSTDWMFAEAEAIRADDQRGRMQAHAIKSMAVNRLNAMIQLLESEDNIPLSPDMLDTDPYLLNVENGVLDLRTGELHSHDRSHYITKSLQVMYSPTAEAPRWERFLSEVFEDEAVAAYIQRVIGYCLTGDVTEDAFWIAYGSGANGKSTFYDTLKEIFGAYGGTADPNLLLETRNEPHPTGLADLYGKRFVTAIETQSGRHLNEALVKQLTGGDRLKARRMRENFWEFKPTHKIHLVTNHRPLIKDNGEAMWRRPRLIPFPRSFRENPEKDLAAVLFSEREGILRWAVEGARLWRQHGLNEPQVILDATQRYREEQDYFGAWISQCCEEGLHVQDKTSTLYDSFTAWCHMYSMRSIPNMHTFGQTLTDRGYVTLRVGSSTVRQGIRAIRRQRTIQQPALQG